MHEVSGPFDSASNTSSTFTSPTPKVKRVTVTETIYDEEGRVVKETVTETEYVEATMTPYYPYQPTWYSGSISNIPDTSK